MGQFLSKCFDEMSRWLQNLLTSIRSYTSLSNGSSNNSKNGSSQPPLLKPAMEGNLSKMKDIVAQYLTNEIITNDNKPSDVKNRLKKLKSFVDLSDAAQNTSLHGAAFAGHVNIIQYLVEQCQADIFQKNNLGCSPLWLTAGYGHTECFLYLFDRVKQLSNESNNETITRSDDNELRFVDEHVFYTENNTGDSPLLAAVSQRHEKMCQVILECSFNAQGSSIEERNIESLFRCTKHVLTKQNRNGDTPLTVAISNAKDEDACIKVISILMKYDKMIIQHEKSNKQSTITSNTSSHILNTRNKNGLTPLLIACERNLPKVIESLIEKFDSQIDCLDEKGNTPLAIASFCGNMEATKVLLDFSKNNKKNILNVPNKEGCTPLWLACRTGNTNMVQLLLDAGADTTIANSSKLNPLEVAKKYGKEKVIELFQKR